jgi:subtilisin family serine protease
MRIARPAAARRTFIAALTLVCITLFSGNIHAQIQAQEPTQRMMVVLAPGAVAAQRVGANDRLENIFPDQRVQQSPRAWSAVSLQTALLVRDIENRIGAKALVTFGNLSHGFGAELTSSQIEALRSDSRVQDIFADPVGEPAANPPDWYNLPMFGPGYTYTNGYNLYAIDAISGTPGWNVPATTPSYRTQGGYPVKAYVIDSGIQPHFDLNYNWQVDHISFDCHKNVGGNECAEGQTPVYSYVGCGTHGTEVAGVLGAKRENAPLGVEGVAPGAQLVSVKVGNFCKSLAADLNQGPQPKLVYYGGSYLSGVVSAINWIAAQVPNNGVDGQGRRRLSAVANMSILWNGLTPQYPEAYIPPAGQAALTSAISAAVAKGIFFSFAGGNLSEDACMFYPAKIGSLVSGAMAVGAISPGGWTMRNLPEGKAASYGPCVEIWAPGQSVQSTAAFPGILPEQNIKANVIYPENQPPAWGPGVPNPPNTSNMQAGLHLYLESSGSSMAAPHVAGAALLLARKRQLTGQPLPSPAEIEQTLLAKTKILPAPKDKYGGLGNPPPITPLPVRILTVDQF